MPANNEPTVCPICHGTGVLIHVDEEVCCQVEVPCWACSLPSEEKKGSES
jgi:hypothetical protein